MLTLTLVIVASVGTLNPTPASLAAPYQFPDMTIEDAERGVQCLLWSLRPYLLQKQHAKGLGLSYSVVGIIILDIFSFVN